ncbi:response regulator [Armatimonas sp.]|uniref:response regulator n=1 Tax=Armatimonas sp. TaxID=1872638 RepID=UPI003753A84D
MKTILVADDEPNIRRLIQVNLERAGYCVETAENGKQAWERLQQGGIDLLVADQWMPERGGFKLADTIQASDLPLASLPIILLLILVNFAPDPRFQVKPEWKSEYICKPFDPQELIRMINRRLGSMSDAIQ